MPLTEDSILCTTLNPEIAIEIERKMKGILTKAGDLGNFDMDGEGSVGSIKENSNYVVYLTERKNDSDKCKFCEKVWLSTAEEKVYHIETEHWHEISVLMSAIEKLKAKDPKHRLIAEWEAKLE
ncbi:hypothetical protein PVAND_008827 [Polypedilum vanderplanki]|uniref:Uncharacterized protein n=1 Tax=Polypedilum vanderplanki TaxID=319348 RepID=A0A9J6CB70_POLVA|nr:hypothetical protein PVAND_008827 [Polypedilum vanderplanki]